VTVTANLSHQPYDGIDADGVLATAPGVAVHTYPGGHWVIVENGSVVRQPVGGDITLTLPGSSVTTADGRPVPFTAAGGSVTFTYREGVDAYSVH
jgi:hypothetical protein